MRIRTAAAAALAAAAFGTVLSAVPAQAADRKDVTINIADGYCLDIPNSNAFNGQVVQQWQCNGTNAQRWNILDFGASHFKIQSVAWPQFCLNNWSGGNTQGDYIKLYNNCDSPDAAFNIVGTDFGNYIRFQPMKATSNCVNMWGGQVQGAVARLYPCSDDGPNARFRLWKTGGI
ncbi:MULTISPECIES: RICIN domain-containing protein [Streptomyces]|uniref:RICIN domain-containing protein n=1 Tax=Streptomyces flavotricini TaxID=66888 RepID=A0ABS8E9T7_9ACTN|nr:RICIN domain-containing protein [Streptomyces flavotricini]MCC0097479.1 RICIN domain-containing protein [Streptomyces flavotricini]